MAELSIVTTCMGRLQYLQRSLPCMVAQPGCEVLVVDYTCPERCGDWVSAELPKARVVRVYGQSEFNPSRARNAGAAVALSEWLCFIDADVLLVENFAALVLPLLAPGRYYRPEHITEGLSGAVVCRRTDFERIGGYDEVLVSWGGEDDDILEMLQFIGRQPASFPSRLLSHIPHGDAERTRFFSIKNRQLSWTRNRIYRQIKHDLMRMQGGLLPEPSRRSISDLVGKTIDESSRAQAALTIKMDLGETLLSFSAGFDADAVPAAQPPAWGVQRSLSYTVRPVKE